MLDFNYFESLRYINLYSMAGTGSVKLAIMFESKALLLFKLLFLPGNIDRRGHCWLRAEVKNNKPNK